jgi:hypothetical protein
MTIDRKVTKEECRKKRNEEIEEEEKKPEKRKFKSENGNDRRNK